MEREEMKVQFGLRGVVIIAMIAFGLGMGTGIAGWIMVFRGGNDTVTETASDRAPQLSLGGNSETSAEPEATPTESSALTGIFAKPIGNSLRQQTATPTPTPMPEPITIERGLYRINPEASEVRFILQEDLRGQRIDVIGTTQDVGGDFIVDYVNPGSSEVGQILINARTLTTDNNFRNGALRSDILRSAEDAYEFITFTPTEIVNLPDSSVTMSGEIEFTVTGDLTILDTTLPVSFDVVATVSDNQIAGTGSTVVLWADYGITIPNVPGVANITPEATLEINFVADLVESGPTVAMSAGGSVDYSQGLFRINPELSEARFILQEDLRGSRIDVIGVTQDVGGDVIIDVATPANSQVGEIAVNARTLTTDNNFRNGALRSDILRSAEDAYEFITFAPTAVTGLENVTVAVGEEITFQIEGDLTILDTTLPVIFDVTAVLTSPEQLSGSASVVVLWADYGITIPSVPGVANITPEVTLEINFVADLIDSQ
jgi:polyisoprenoid-binding protein YceI